MKVPSSPTFCYSLDTLLPETGCRAGGVEARRRGVKAAVAVLVVLLASASPSSGQQEVPPEARVVPNGGSGTDQPDPSGSDPSGSDPSRPSSVAKKAVSLGLILVGAAAVVVGEPDYTPSQFIPGNYRNRVDIRGYLPHGNYTGHTYRLQRRRGPRYGHRWSCPHPSPSCRVTDEQLYDNYINGYTDGYDDGLFSGRVEGHRDGWTQCWRARATEGIWTRVDRKMLWPPAASSDRQRARVLTGVKARRCAPPPLRGADGLDAGSAHARPGWLLPTMPTPTPPTCCGRPPVQNAPLSRDR